VSTVFAPLFEPGLFADGAVRGALLVGLLVAVVSGVVGVFTVIRSQSFAAEALGDLGAAGGSGAFLLGAGPLSGFLVVDVMAALAMALVGTQRPRMRDLATGLVLGAGLGLAALLLYLASTQTSASGATVTVLFGSIFSIAHGTLPAIALLSAGVLALVAVLYRPLLLASVNGEIAAARGIRVGALGGAYLVALGLAVALAALTIGAILSTALIVGPAACALRLTRRPARAIALAGAIGVASMWIGIVLAYDSFYWPPKEHGWPVSFFVVAVIFIAYLLSGLPRVRARCSRAS
jgi:zinc/manganese transport system permease protein